MARTLKDDLKDLPTAENPQPLKKVVYKTPARVMQASATTAVAFAAVTFLAVLGGQVLLQAGAGLDMGVALRNALGYTPPGFLVGAVLGALEFAFLRKGRRE